MLQEHNMGLRQKFCDIFVLFSTAISGYPALVISQISGIRPNPINNNLDYNILLYSKIHKS